MWGAGVGGGEQRLLKGCLAERRRGDAASLALVVLLQYFMLMHPLCDALTSISIRGGWGGGLYRGAPLLSLRIDQAGDTRTDDKSTNGVGEGSREPGD